MKENDIKKEADDEDEEPEGFSDKEKPMPTREYKIMLPLVQRNGLHVMAARWHMSFSQVVTIALEELLRLKMSMGNYTMLNDSTLTDDLIGESLARDMGLRGYYDRKQIPADKRFYFVTSGNEDETD